MSLGTVLSIISIAIAALIGIMSLIKPNRIPHAKVLTFMFIVISALIQVIDVIQQDKEIDKIKYYGTLEPENKILLSTADNTIPKIEIGDSGTIFVWNGPQGMNLFTIFDDNALKILSENGQIKLSTLIRDKNGNVVAEIVDNEWRSNIRPISWDRNYNKHAIEVKDRTGDVILQVRVLNDRIQFQGKFYSGSGDGFALVAAPWGTGAIMEIKKNDEHLESHIEPIFKYPSDSHLGELIKIAIE